MEDDNTQACRILIEDEIYHVEDHYYKSGHDKSIYLIFNNLDYIKIKEKSQGLNYYGFDLIIHSFQFNKCKIFSATWVGDRMHMCLRYKSISDLGYDAIRDSQLKKLLD